MSEPLILTDADRKTPLWHKLKTHYSERLNVLRAKNDNDKDEVQTAKQRGQILEVKELLKLDKDVPVFEAPVPRIDA